MGHTFLCVLSFCWLNILFCGETQAVEETGAKATVTADRTVIPAGGSVTLTCSVQDPTVFKYDWFRETSTSNKDFYKDEEESNRISVSQGGIYTCRGQRKKRTVTIESDPVTILETGFAETGAKATVTADRTVIPAGGSVTLTCSVQDPTVVKYHWFRQTSTSNKVFYKEAGGSNRVSVSQGGIYTCRGLRNERSVTPESDSVTIEETAVLPVLLIAGLVCGFILIVLILLFLYRCCRGGRIQRTSPGCTTIQGVSESEAQSNELSSPLQDASQSQDVTYSVIELKNFGKKVFTGKHHKAEKSLVYSEVKIRHAGNISAAAAYEVVYSETAVGNNAAV